MSIVLQFPKHYNHVSLFHLAQLCTTLRSQELPQDCIYWRNWAQNLHNQRPQCSLDSAIGEAEFVQGLISTAITH